MGDNGIVNIYIYIYNVINQTYFIYTFIKYKIIKIDRVNIYM